MSGLKARKGAAARPDGGVCWLYKVLLALARECLSVPFQAGLVVSIRCYVRDLPPNDDDTQTDT